MELPGYITFKTKLTFIWKDSNPSPVLLFQPMLSIYVSWKYQLTFSNPSLFLFIHYKYCHSISLSSLPLKEFFVCIYLGVFRSVFAMTSECICGCMCACVVCAHVCQRADFRIHLIPSTVSSREQTQVTGLE